MTLTGPGAVPAVELIAFIAVLATQRLWELSLSARNVRWLTERGAREHGREHYPWLVALHALFPFALAAEVLMIAARPGRFAIGWLALWLAAQALRISAMRALGPRWSTRVLVVPGMPPVAHGPYRWLRHPNYLAVVIEFVAAPMMFGAWRTALVFSLANLALLRVRVRCEERALGEADGRLAAEPTGRGSSPRG